jgi:BTB/POZ domain
MTLLVGEEEKSFSVHKSLVYEHAPSVKAGIEGRWTENGTHCFALKEHSCETVGYFLDWIYKGHVDLPKVQRIGDDDPAGGDQSDNFWWAVGQLYVLAEFLLVTKLKKHLTDLVFATGYIDKHQEVTCVWGPPSGMIALVYDKTTNPNPFRKLLVHWCVWNFDKNWWVKEGHSKKYIEETKSVDFLADLSVEAMRRMYASIKKDTSSNPFRKRVKDYWAQELQLVRAAFIPITPRKRQERSTRESLWPESNDEEDFVTEEH